MSTRSGAPLMIMRSFYLKPSRSIVVLKNLFMDIDKISLAKKYSNTITQMAEGPKNPYVYYIVFESFTEYSVEKNIISFGRKTLNMYNELERLFCGDI
jgi:hypothetical protein